MTIVILGTQGVLEAAGTELEIIKVRNRPVMEIFPVVQQLVSSKGRVSADRFANVLVVVDDPTTLATIIRIVKELDQVMPQVSVTFRYQEAGEREGQLGTGVMLPQGGVTLSTRKSRAMKQLMVRSSSGSPAYLSVGRNIVFDNFWMAVFRKHGVAYIKSKKMRRIETGIEVTATVFGNQVELMLLPRISFIKEDVIYFREAALKLSVVPGRWTAIGAMADQQREMLRAVVLGTTTRRNEKMFMEVLVRLE